MKELIKLEPFLTPIEVNQMNLPLTQLANDLLRDYQTARWPVEIHSVSSRPRKKKKMNKNIFISHIVTAHTVQTDMRQGVVQYCIVRLPGQHALIIFLKAKFQAAQTWLSRGKSIYIQNGYIQSHHVVAKRAGIVRLPGAGFVLSSTREY